MWRNWAKSGHEMLNITEGEGYPDIKIAVWEGLAKKTISVNHRSLSGFQEQ